LSEPATKDVRDEDESSVNDASSRPPAGGVASDTGVTGVAVDCAGAATVLAVGTASVPMAVRTPANVPSEINMVTIQEAKFFFIPDTVPGLLSPP
jgi:hypothetical protein